MFCNLLVYNNLQIWHEDCYAQIQMKYQPIKLQHYEQEIIFRGTARNDAKWENGQRQGRASPRRGATTVTAGRDPWQHPSR